MHEWILDGDSGGDSRNAPCKFLVLPKCLLCTKLGLWSVAVLVGTCRRLFAFAETARATPRSCCGDPICQDMDRLRKPCQPAVRQSLLFSCASCHLSTHSTTPFASSAAVQCLTVPPIPYAVAYYSFWWAFSRSRACLLPTCLPCRHRLVPLAPVLPPSQPQTFLGFPSRQGKTLV